MLFRTNFFQPSCLKRFHHSILTEAQFCTSQAAQFESDTFQGLDSRIDLDPLRMIGYE